MGLAARVGRLRVLLGAVVLLGVLTPRLADACTCGGPSPWVSPIDGQEDVPLNTWIVIHDDTKRQPVPDDAVIVDVATGRAIPLVHEEVITEDSGITTFLRPTELLREDTLYDAPFTRFTTGSRLAGRPTPFVALHDARALVSFEIGGSTCDHVHDAPDWRGESPGIPRLTSLCLDHGLPRADTVALQMELSPATGEGPASRILVPPFDDRGERWWPSLGPSICGVLAPSFLPGDSLLVTLRALGATGQWSAATTPLLVTAEEVTYDEVGNSCSGLKDPSPPLTTSTHVDWSPAEGTSASVGGCTCATGDGRLPNHGVLMLGGLAALRAAARRRPARSIRR